MGRIPTGDVIWSLRRYIRDGNLWDHFCSRCKQATPVFEYEHRDEQGEQRRPVFGYLCEGCAQKKLAEWLQCAESPDYVHLGYQTDFDIATVFYEQKNDAETLVLTRWSPEQRRRRLQIAPEEGAHGNLANLMSARAVYRRCITHCRSEEIPS